MTKIMLVEDDNNLREIYEARLSAEGYDIVAAPNGEAALAIASKEHPDMIISDVMMPKISGFEMLDILRNTESLRDVKIIMLTALGQAEDSQRADSLGADRYLIKSQVTLEDIVRTAHELLNDVDSSSVPADDTATNDTSVQAAPAPEPVAVAEEPIDDTPPILDTMPVAPQPAPTDATAAQSDASTTVPVVSEPPTGDDTSTMPQEDATPIAEPELAADPAATPAPAPSVISIPVSDSTDSTDNTNSPVDTDNDTTGAQTTLPETDVPAPSEPLTIVEPTSEFEAPLVETNDMPVAEAPEETQEAAAPDIITIPEPTTDDVAPTDDTLASPSEEIAVSDTTASTDYTSPQNFNMVQTDGVVSAPEVNTEIVESASQDTASEEATMKAQIDSFISNPNIPTEAPASEDISTAMDYAPLESEPAESEAVATPSVEAPVVQASPSIEIPSIISNPIETTENTAPTVIEVTDGSSVVEPQPETLDDFAPPIISAPGETTVMPVAAPVPQPVEQVEPVAVDTSNGAAAAYDDQLVQNAAEDLAAGAPNDVAAPSEGSGEADTNDAPQPQSTSRMKTVAPIPSDTAKPTIHQLLELEEAKNAANQAAANTQPAVPNVDAYKPTTPDVPADNKPGIDPNSISL